MLKKYKFTKALITFDRKEIRTIFKNKVTAPVRTLYSLLHVELPIFFEIKKLVNNQGCKIPFIDS